MPSQYLNLCCHALLAFAQILFLTSACCETSPHKVLTSTSAVVWPLGLAAFLYLQGRLAAQAHGIKDTALEVMPVTGSLTTSHETLLVQIFPVKS